MAQLQITVEIADEPVGGYQLEKLRTIFGESAGTVLGRIVSANAATYPRFEVDAVKVLTATIAAAVTAAEA